MVEKDTLVRDFLFFIKDDLAGSITDPITSTRSTNSNFVMTSYPSRHVQYPVVTIKITNIESIRAGMQVTTQDITLTMEIRIWARNEKEKDEIFDWRDINPSFDRISGLYRGKGYDDILPDHPRSPRERGLDLWREYPNRWRRSRRFGSMGS